MPKASYSSGLGGRSLLDVYKLPCLQLVILLVYAEPRKMSFFPHPGTYAVAQVDLPGSLRGLDELDRKSLGTLERIPCIEPDRN